MFMVAHSGLPIGGMNQQGMKEKWNDSDQGISLVLNPLLPPGFDAMQNPRSSLMKWIR